MLLDSHIQFHLTHDSAAAVVSQQPLAAAAVVAVVVSQQPPAAVPSGYKRDEKLMRCLASFASLLILNKMPACLYESNLLS